MTVPEHRQGYAGVARRHVVGDTQGVKKIGAGTMMRAAPIYG